MQGLQGLSKAVLGLLGTRIRWKKSLLRTQYHQEESVLRLETRPSVLVRLQKARKALVI